MAISLNAVIEASWPAVLPAVLQGKSWSNWDLLELEQEGRLTVVPFVQGLKDAKPAVLRVPIVWTKNDILKQTTEAHKIHFVKVLLENAISAHDDLLALRLDEYPHAVSFQVDKPFKYVMSEIVELPDSSSFMMMLTTAVSAGILE